MNIVPLPDSLAAVPSPVGSDPDGVKEREVAALALAGDCVAAAGVALTIEHPIRRALWLRQFRPSTLAAAKLQVHEDTKTS